MDDPDREELAELAERSIALRVTVTRLQSDLAAVNLEQAAISARLRALGFVVDDEELKTRVDKPVAESVLPPPVVKIQDVSTLKAAGAGAGLTVGVVLVLLVALDLGASRTRGAVVTAPSASATSAASVNGPTWTAVAPPAPAPARTALTFDDVTPLPSNAPTLSVADLPAVPKPAVFTAVPTPNAAPTSGGPPADSGGSRAPSGVPVGAAPGASMNKASPRDYGF